MRTWTVDEMLAEGPCADYTRERIEELWAGREALSLLEILHLDIPAEDRVWVACRPSALDCETRAKWLDGVVARAVRNHALHCDIPAVERWAALWLDRTAQAAEAARAAAAEAEAAAKAGYAWLAEREQQVADLREILED